MAFAVPFRYRTARLGDAPIALAADLAGLSNERSAPSRPHDVRAGRLADYEGTSRKGPGMQTTALGGIAANVPAQAPGLAESTPHGKRRSRWLGLLLKVAFTALTIGAILYTVDLPAAWQRTAHQRPWLLAVAVAIILVQIVLGALRWHVILARLGAPISVAASLRLFYASVFFNTCFVGSLGGDLVRAWLAYRARIGAVTSVHSVILDRVAALAGIALLVIVTAPLFVARTGWGLPALLPAGLAVIGLAGIVVGAHLDRMPARWLRLRPLRLLQALGGAMRGIFLRPASAVPTLALAVAAQAAMALSAYAVAASLDIDVTAVDCLVLMQPVALLTALPISIGGWGVRETAMIGLFGLIGVPASAALVLSVQIGLLTILASLPGGVLWLLLRQGAASARPAGTAASRPVAVGR